MIVLYGMSHGSHNAAIHLLYTTGILKAAVLSRILLWPLNVSNSHYHIVLKIQQDR